MAAGARSRASTSEHAGKLLLQLRRLKQLPHSAAGISCCISSAGSASQRLLTSCRRRCPGCRLAAHRRGLLLAALACERPLLLGHGSRLGLDGLERRSLPPPLGAGLAVRLLDAADLGPRYSGATASPRGHLPLRLQRLRRPRGLRHA